MGLLAPLFLVGLVGLAVPILVHLTERQRRNVVDFPSLMFLRKIPFRSTQRRRIHHWSLLSIRALALALLVAAFARPFFESTEVAIGSTLGPREVVVVLDHSYSMGYGDRWERAKTRAREVFQGLDASDRASLIFMGRGAEALVRATSDRGRLLTVLDTASLSADPRGVRVPESGGRHHQRLPARRVERRRGRFFSIRDSGRAGGDFR
jgi:hypothetical protein